MRNNRAIKSNGGNWKKGGNDPAVEGVFRIVIQRSFKEMVDLPELKVWSMLPRTIQSRMLVRVRRYGFFFTHDTEEAPLRCILTRRNYLIIYAKEKQLKGYAVKLSLAEKLNIACGRGEKGRCLITIKWQFGEITLAMLKDQAANWRFRILEAFEGVNASLPSTREIGVQTTMNYTPAMVSSAIVAKEKPVFPPIIVPLPAVSEKTFAHSPEVAEKTFMRSPTVAEEKSAHFSANADDTSVLSSSIGEETSAKSPAVVEETSIRQSILRRSVSTPSIDMSKFNAERIHLTAPLLFGPRKVTFPKRSISRIERPIAAPQWTPAAPWCIVVKRYDLPDGNEECSYC